MGVYRSIEGFMGVYKDLQGYRRVDGGIHRFTVPGTVVYKGLWGYTRAYIGIEEFMGVYKGLQWYKRVYGGVQGYTRVFTLYQGITVVYMYIVTQLFLVVYTCMKASLDIMKL